MKYFALFAFLLLNSFGWSQIIHFETEMAEEVEETSGLLFINDKVITHNDSGGDPTLYEIDPDSGDITREIFISNATNIDWEDLSSDADYIYIADYGNNDGSRTDLKIYRITLANFLASNTVTADIINFSYSDQIDFSPNTSTNFDAETLISFHDSLYIFTKNRGDFHSNIYPVPKTPGNYQISKIGSINPQILVTGGTYDEAADAVVLTGYSSTGPYILTLNNFESEDLMSGTLNKYLVEINGFSIQIEGIAAIGQNQFYISAEGNSAVDPQLFKLDADEILAIEPTNNLQYRLFPNPATQQLNIECKDFSSLEIYTAQGQLLLNSNKKTINVSMFAKGIYISIVKDQFGHLGIQKLVIE